jgi:hypothetical protein
MDQLACLTEEARKLAFDRFRLCFNLIWRMTAR